MIRSIVYLMLLFCLGACQQLLNGQAQPVRPLSNGEYHVSCSGSVENWTNCNLKAMRTCPNGYEEISKEENTMGTKREIIFRCRK